MSSTDYTSGYTPQDFTGVDTYSANGTFPHSGDVTTGGWHLQRSGTNIFSNGELLTYTYTNGAGVWSHPHMGTSYSNGRVQLIYDPTNPNPALRVPEFDFLESDAFVAGGGGTSTEGSSAPSGSKYVNANGQIVFVIHGTSPSSDGTVAYKIFRRPVGGTFQQAYVVSHTNGTTNTDYNVGSGTGYERWELRVESSTALVQSGTLASHVHSKKVFCNFW